MRHLTLITTGGTIEKTYDEQTGTLLNRKSIVQRMLKRLRLEDTRVCIDALMHKDSLVMTDDDRRQIVEAVRLALSVQASSGNAGGVVILHGTDTLCTTGDLLASEIPNPSSPIVLTGAMRPYEMTRSDAIQNLTEAILATSIVVPGVYVAAHGRVLKFPGVTKDREHGTFVRAAR